MSEAPALVTGATGFIGQHLARALLGDGAPPRLFVRDRARLAADLAQHCEVVLGDLGDPEAVRRAVRGCGTVFHCAAQVATWGSWDDYRRPNVDGLGHLLAALAAEPSPRPRLVHLSSVDVYGFPASPRDEGAPLDDAGFLYGRSKIEGEALLRRLGDAHQIPWTILRPTNVFGPGSPFVERIGEALRDGVMVEIDGGRAHAGVLAITDLVFWMRWAATAPAALGATFNARSPIEANWREVVASLRRAAGLRGLVIPLEGHLALAVARLMAGAWRGLGLRSEPLLHPLIVRIFGRTCGHDARALWRASRYGGTADLDGLMAASVQRALQAAP